MFKKIVAAITPSAHSRRDLGRLGTRLGSPEVQPFYIIALTIALLISSYNLGMAQQKALDLKGGTAAGGTAAAPAPSAAPTTANVTTGDLPVMGNANAKLTIVEFADFRCPFCEQFFKTVEPNLIKDYVDTGKVKFAFRNNAILGQQSTWAAEAAECANEQGKFWQYHDWLYQNQVSESNLDFYSKDNLIKYATDLGMNHDQFASCLNSDKYSSNVQKDVSDAQSAGITGTPTTVIGNQIMAGAQPYASFQSQIDTLLAK